MPYSTFQFKKICTVETRLTDTVRTGIKTVNRIDSQHKYNNTKHNF